MDQQNEALDNTPASEEEQVNAAAKAEIEASQKSEQAQGAEVAKPVVTDPASVKSPNNSAPTGQPVVEAQKGEDWQRKVSELEKQYSETRRWATQMAQERAAAKKELDAFKAQQKALEARIKEATRQPFNLEKFNREFAETGFKAFDPYIAEKLDEVRNQYEEKLAAFQESQQMAIAKAEAAEVNLAIMSRKMDSKNYPDFAALEPQMAAILNSPNCPIDKNLPLEERIDAVYSLARTQHSEEAIKAAQNDGYVKAQAELAKEAKTAVASGGKGVSTTPANLHDMPYEKLEQYVKQTYGVFDRD